MKRAGVPCGIPGPLFLQTAWRLRATGEGEVWSDRHAGEGSGASEREGRIGVEVQGAACAGGNAVDGVAGERRTLGEGDSACRPRTCVGTARWNGQRVVDAVR